jgi:peptide subunit release factor 1 (eRF1)
VQVGKRKVDRDPPPPGRAAELVAERVDREHPKRPLLPVTVSARPIHDVVEDLKGFVSPDVPVVSVYWSVPADLGQLRGAAAKLRDLARPVRERADVEDLSHAARISLRADADRILDLEQLAPRLHGRTLALFRCHAQGFEEAVVMTGRVGDRVELDATPYVRPILAMLDEAHRYAVAIVDREHGQLFAFELGVLQARERVDGRALRMPNFAPGDKEYGVHHKAQELAKRHYRAVADELNRVLEESGLELAVVGGHEDTVSAFLEELPKDLRQKVVGAFVIDPHTMTPASARDAAQRAVDAYERQEEEQLVAKAFERVAAGGFGAVGLEWCLLATDERGVDVLLVQADATSPGRVCDRCGWLGLSEEVCPVDGSRTRETNDIIDEMAALVIGSSGRVEHVFADTPLRDHLVAALLRFPVQRPEGAISQT